MRTILHVDLNNFYASVECLYRTEIRQYPVAVCGDPLNRQGIVLAKNMLAKKLGVTTGEPIWQAKIKAPELVVVPPDFKKYLRFSRMAREIYCDYTDRIEPFGIDECWLDVSGGGDGKIIADNIRQRIREELGITASAGVSFNKIFAKLGSDMKKPDATTVISEKGFKDVVWPLPVEDLLYVGRATSRKLHNYGLTTIGRLAQVDRGILVSNLGKWGEVLWLFANGFDTSPVRKVGEGTTVKSVGNSTTCPRDLFNDEDVKLVFTVLAESVAVRLRDYGLKCAGVAISYRDKELFSLTRQGMLTEPTYLSDPIINKAMELFVAHYGWEKPLRSVGLRGINLVTAKDLFQLSLFDDAAQRTLAQEALAHTIDSIRGRFGQEAIVRASCLLDSKLTGFNPKEDHVIHPVSFFK